MRSFVARAMLSQKQVTTAGFDQTLAVTYQKASVFTRFLCEALDLSF
jgi:hypothetical protein